MNNNFKEGLYIFDHLIVSIVPITLVAKRPLAISILTSFSSDCCCMLRDRDYRVLTKKLKKIKSETDTGRLEYRYNGVAFFRKVNLKFYKLPLIVV